jgi:hypothetical protein
MAGAMERVRKVVPWMEQVSDAQFDDRAERK